MKTKNVALIGGYVATNVGNDFFTKSIHRVLSGLFPDWNIRITQSQPGYFWNEKGGNPANSFDYIRHLDLDYFIVSGPLFDTRFPLIWGDTLRALREKGTEILIFSAGSQRYNQEERDRVGAFLREIKPLALVSRDTPTYEAYRDLAAKSYDGIDFAFFLNEVFTPFPIQSEKYVVLNFDTSPEPRFAEAGKYPDSFTFLGKERSYKMKHPGKISKFIYRKYPWWFDYENPSFDDYLIVRPKNYTNPGDARRLFNTKNSYVSELPEDYLNIFANAEGVLSSRVHSCISSLVFGKEAMLFSTTRRKQLFARVGLEHITREPVKLDQAYISEEREKMRTFIKGIFS